MPTGYTAKLIESGQTFKEFAMTCARAFGALVDMRDDPIDVPIRDFEPSDYYVTLLRERGDKLHKLCKMDVAEQLAHGESLREQSIKSAKSYLASNKLENSRIDGVAEEVSNWVPPTPDHEEMKTFMLQQLEISRHGSDYAETTLSEAIAKQATEYFADDIEYQRRGMEYCKEEIQKEIDRCKGRNEWVRKLRESLQSSKVER